MYRLLILIALRPYYTFASGGRKILPEAEFLKKVAITKPRLKIQILGSEIVKGTRIIMSLFEPGLEIDPLAIALINNDGDVLTHGQLKEIVNHLTGSLWEKGIKIETRIAVVMPGSLEMFLTFLAVSNVAVFIPLNSDYSKEQYIYHLQLLKVDMVLTDQSDSIFEQAAEMLGLPIFQLQCEKSNNNISYHIKGRMTPRSEKNRLPQDEDIALLQFTSGTTADPKIVPRSHRNICFSNQQRKEEMRLQSTDKVLITFPSYRGITLTDTMVVLTSGGTVIYTDSIEARQILSSAEKHDPTIILGSPVVFSSLSAYAEKHGYRYTNSHLKYIRTSGAPLDDKLAQRLAEIFKVPVYEGYGSTECGNIAFSMNAPLGPRPG